MKKDNILGTVWKEFALSFFVLILAVLALSISCKHSKESKKQGGGSSGGVQKPKKTDLNLSVFTIKDNDAKSGSLTFKGDSLTIIEDDVTIKFTEDDAPKPTCSETFPITLKAGDKKTLTFSIPETEKYNVWSEKVVIQCTNKNILEIEKITVHRKKVDENFSIELNEKLDTVLEENVNVFFKQPNPPTYKLSGLPIKLKKGEKPTFKISTQENETYAYFEKIVTIKVVGGTKKTDLNLSVFTIKTDDAKSGSLTFKGDSLTIIEDDVIIKFTEDDAPKPTCSETFPITLKAGDKKTLTFSIPETEKYNVWSRSVEISVEKLKRLHIEELRIYNSDASSGECVVDTNITKIEKKNVTLKFKEKDAPKDFEFSCDPQTMQNPGDVVKIKLSTQATKEYDKWDITINAKRGKDPSAPKDIDDCVASLRNQIAWASTTVSQNIILPTQVTDFDGSLVSWHSNNEEYCTETGEITRDLKDIEVELNAIVRWNGEERSVIFKVVLARIELLTEKQTNPTEEVYEYDFSDKNFLVYKKDNAPQKKFEIKSIDVAKKEIAVRLIQEVDEDDGMLKNLEDVKDKNVERLGLYFGLAYRKLMGLPVITWQNVKEYLKTIRNENDDTILFNFFKSLLMYQGNLESFENLQDAIRTKLVKDTLHKYKREICAKYEVDENTPDENLETALKSAAEENNVRKIAFRKEEKVFRYTLEKIELLNIYPEGMSFSAYSKYNPQKKWNEQLGRYTYSNSNDKSSCELNFDLVKKSGNTDAYFYYSDKHGQGNFSLEVKLDGNFTGFLKEDSNFKLSGNLQDTKDGNITLRATGGAFTGEYTLKFEGRHLFFY